MNVLLFTHGSRGDIVPFVALARALNMRGHQATLSAPAGSAFLAEPYGVRLAPLHDEMESLTTEPVYRAMFETGHRGLRGKKLTVQVMHKYRSMMIRVLEDMAAAAGPGTDLVVHQPGLPGHEVAEQLGVPAVPVCLEPTWVSNRSFPNPIFPFRVPRVLNRATYRWTRLWSRGFVGDTDRWRREALGLPHRRGHRNPLLRPDGKPATVLQAFSRHMLPPSADFPRWVHTTGLWFLPSPPDWKPPRQLCDFLAAGDPPVYIGFGSSVGADPGRTGRIVLEAVRLAGVRAVVVTGYGGIQASESTDDVLLLDEAPFDWLFPRMAAIVHHGGSGTTGAALAAGRPQVICPFIIYQNFYAWRAPATGIAPASIPQPKLTPHNLADAIRRAVTDRTLAKRADDLKHQIRAEQGVTTASQILETLR